MVALCFDLTQNIVINENEHKCHNTHMYSLYTTLRKKERKKESIVSLLWTTLLTWKSIQLISVRCFKIISCCCLVCVMHLQI